MNHTHKGYTDSLEVPREICRVCC